MAIQATDILFGFAAAVLICIISVKLRLLDLVGGLAAVVVGTIIFGLGGIPMSAALIWFFASSNLLGKYRKTIKAAHGYEKDARRDVGQVFANGAGASLCLVLAVIFPHDAAILKCGALAAICACASDTWATEVGSALSAPTILITTLKPVRVGQSGGISWPGSVAALVGSISTAAIFAALNSQAWKIAELAAGCGVFGCMIDSLLGATVQAQYQSADGKVVEFSGNAAILARGARWMNNDVVNFLASTIAAGTAILLLTIHS